MNQAQSSPLGLTSISENNELLPILHHFYPKESMLRLLWEQYVHDELFHMDIFSLPLLEKVTHHTLHLTKYYTELIHSAEQEGSLHVSRLVDTLSTCLSLFGIFNIVPTFTKESFTVEIVDNNYEEDYSTLISILSKWAEQNKHGPVVTYSRKRIVDEIERVFCNTIVLLMNHRFNPVAVTNDRRLAIQQRSIFYEMLHKRYNRMCSCQ